MNLVRQAHRAVRLAVSTGALVRPSRCAECGQLCKTQGAHYDYRRPLDVRWLCASCHTRWDRAEPKGPAVEWPYKGVNRESSALGEQTQLLRPIAVAAQLGVSGSTVRRWIIDGHLPSIKTPGGQYRIDPRTLDEWLAKLDRAPEPEAA